MNQRLRQSSAVPTGTLSQPLDWRRVVDVTRQFRLGPEDWLPSPSSEKRDGLGRPSSGEGPGGACGPLTEFHVVAYAVARAAALHPRFRSTLAGDDALEESPHVQLGVAVHLANDDLTLAVVRDADRLPLRDFAAELDLQIRAAMNGEELYVAQPGYPPAGSAVCAPRPPAAGGWPTSDVRLVLTYLGGLPATDAVPLLVSPATGVLFLGAPYPTPEGPRAKLCLTFDHRVANGVAAARFLDEIARQIERLAAHDTNGHVDARPRGWLANALRTAQASERAAMAQRAVAELVEEVTGKRAQGTDMLPLPPGERRGEDGGPAFDVASSACAHQPEAPARRVDNTPSLALRVSVDEPLRHFGLTSLAAVELAGRLSDAVAQPLPQTLVWSYPTIAAIAAHLLGVLALANGEVSRAEPADIFDADLLAKIEKLSPVEAADLLALFRDVERPSSVGQHDEQPSQAVPNTESAR